MASIYNNSYITIAATKSLDATGGLFSKTQATHITQPYDFVNANGHTYDVHVRQRIPHFSRGADFPLLSRAWVLQEQLLSPRTVHFGPNELLWECMEGPTCECSCYSRGYFYSKAQLLDPDNLTHHQPRTKSSIQYENAKRWHWIVKEYCGKQLTVKTAIFPALQGIAKYLQKERGCSFYAGLLEDSVVEDPLWYKDGIADEERNFITDYKIWRAPTWSWASTTNVRYFTFPAGPDPFGELSGGELKLKGRCIDSVLLNTQQRHHLMIDARRPIMLPFAPDQVLCLPDNTVVKIIVIGRQAAFLEEEKALQLLVFVRGGNGKNMFERIGSAATVLKKHPGLFEVLEERGEVEVLTVV